jgi:phage shock protein PspC (stress-responsive transcriptional regulator)
MNTSASDQESNVAVEAGPAADDQAATGGTHTAGRPGRIGDIGDLYRPIDDRMLAGVASGLARYLNVDATLVRVALIVLVFVGGAGLPLYLAGWLLIPEEGASASIAAELISSVENRSR